MSRNIFDVLVCLLKNQDYAVLTLLKFVFWKELDLLPKLIKDGKFKITGSSTRTKLGYNVREKLEEIENDNDLLINL